MTDKEWIDKVKSMSNAKLIDTLKYCGHDGYYNNLYYPIVAEIKRRLRRAGREKRSGFQADMRGKDAVIDTLDELPSAQPNVPDTNVGDMISRQMAINEIFNADLQIYEGDCAVGRRNYMTKEEVCSIIDSLPSAQQWIPVSVRLPKKEGWYYCTVSADIGGYARELYFEKGRFLDKIRINMFELYNITSKVTGEKILEDSFDWTDVVTAWMPLPEPMKGEGE